MFDSFFQYMYRTILKKNKYFMNIPKPPKNNQELLKFINGPIKYKDLENGFVEILGGWKEENIVEIELPIKINEKYWKIECNKNLVTTLNLLFSAYVLGGREKTYPITQLSCFVPRHKMSNPKRSLSLHSYGIAVDINWKHNKVGTAGNIPKGVVDIFKGFGFTWGGEWKTAKDPMHFEFFG